MSNFVDECNINVKGGDGGAGCVAFRREAHVAKGVLTAVMVATVGRSGLSPIVMSRRCWPFAIILTAKATTGATAPAGTGTARGRDLEVQVPEGTVVLDHASREPLVDLLHHGDRWLAAQAGEGGRGNARFLSNKRRAPSFAEQGEHGEERWLRLELKLMADVAIVGFPNVGKSTFISSVSARSPRSPTIRSRRWSRTSVSSGWTTSSRWCSLTFRASSRARRRAKASAISSSGMSSVPGSCWSSSTSPLGMA